MIVNGIIAEYNPFHNGHATHLSKTSKLTGADVNLVVMSGNFVQRGAPAVIDKYVRTKMALLNGADIVLELPTCYSVSSAEYFAKGAVTMLDKLGIVNYLSFGSECGDLNLLGKIADILSNEPDEYKELLHRNLRDGMSFPLARNNALISYNPSLYDAAKVLESPNNILGIEYLKALKARESKITPFTIPREGSNYHDRFISDSGTRASAQAIREAIASPEGSDFSQVMPANCYDLLKEEIEHGRTMDIDDFSEMLYYKLISEQSIGYSSYLDVSSELSDRILSKLPSFTSAKQFIDLVKTKDRTYTRIARCMMHILLDITSATINDYSLTDSIPYIRVLGFKKESEDILTEIKMHCTVPLVTNLADAKEKLYAEPGKMLRSEIRSNEIFYAARAIKCKEPAGSELSMPIVIL